MTPKQRAAKAIAERNGEVWDELSARTKRRFKLDMEVSLAAIAEPSEAMIKAGRQAYQKMTGGSVAFIWRAMHAAMMAEKDTEE